MNAEIPIHEWFIKNDDPKNDPKNELKNELKISDRQTRILNIIKQNPKVSITLLSEELSVSYTTIKRNIIALSKLGILQHTGPKKGGEWKIMKEE